ncbi:helix-turn-helix transcriptional regulator [Streptomyces pinistramenti]|uniref:helix-turn-helix transcriptional regulator n=1 Tax=Streptomyces pinistramenti TaxID=2884812 RepID=UPI001D08A2F2|nr:AraC family transcriptional regulator [Streptomyces pinistramenti]MCB5907444.1 AraC family transcriptional regulator [Streptomyces pinistramenti]
MDRNGQHTDVTELPYRSAAGAPPGAEVLGFSGLLARARGHGVDPYAPKRPGFHELITVRSGTLRCAVDFTEHELTEGSWLWVRPGQIHQYRSDLSDAEGTVVLFLPGFLNSAVVEAARVDQHPWQRPVAPTGADGQAVRSVLALLESEYRRPAALPLEVHIEVVRHLLAVLVLRLAHLYGGRADNEAGSAAFRGFRRAVERDFTRTHRVEDYAAGLGYSVRTLTRATRATAGCGAKQFIDDRILLEAKRLLVHTDLPATAIGERLGFPGATVFTKFFRRRSGETPAAFRTRASGTRP